MSRLVTAKPSLIPPVSMEEEVRYLTGEKELHLTLERLNNCFAIWCYTFAFTRIVLRN